MSNYTLPPRSKASDYTKGKLTQDEIIALQVSNDANISAARKAVKLGIPPQLTPAQTLSPDELLADDALQEASARNNLERLGFRPQEAAQIITSIRTDNILDFSSLNSNFPAIEADIKGRFNIKLLTPAFFIEYLRQYTQELLASRGLNIGVGNISRNLNALINSVAEIRQVLPSQDQINDLRDGLIRLNRKVANRTLLEPILERINMLGEALPSQTDYGRIENLNIAETQRILQRINTITEDLPTREQVNNLIQQVDRGDRNIIANLTALADSVPDDFKRKMDNVLKEVREIGDIQSQIAGEMELMRRQGPVTTPSKGKQDWDKVSVIIDEAEWKSLNAKSKKLFLKSRYDLGEQVTTTKGDIDTATESSGDLDRLWEKWIADFGLSLISTASSGKEIPSSTTASMTSIVSGATPTGITELMGTLRRSITGETKKKGNGMKVGRGIAVKQTPSYKEYGKYAIHIPQLEQQDLLNVKYKSLGQIPKFKPIPVSDVFRDFLLDLLENGKPNGRVYTQIPTDERKYFEEMSIGAGVWNSLGLKRTTTSTDEEENKRFELLRGEYLAGNNNAKILSELRKLVVKMMNDGRIRKNQGVELLMELSI